MNGEESRLLVQLLEKVYAISLDQERVSIRTEGHVADLEKRFERFEQKVEALEEKLTEKLEELDKNKISADLEAPAPVELAKFQAKKWTAIAGTTAGITALVAELVHWIFPGH